MGGVTAGDDRGGCLGRDRDDAGRQVAATDVFGKKCANFQGVGLHRIKTADWDACYYNLHCSLIDQGCADLCV